ncbi:MAG: mannose-1-phosphate guanylyltransferase/mannose-6-phosphate isomerase [Gammaproteobacteria bacterium]|nr:mannose-1-phosphate guanylyltransferase/mannose-6-phosphate isomerase [Gammaproteobacteria bacterium]
MLIPVILSGGAGTRLWPLSRVLHPKPFLKMPDGNSLLHKTFERACSLPDVTEIITITNKDYYLKSMPEYAKFICAEHLRPKQSFLLEPFGKNTASASALALLKVLETYGEEAILIVLPADHLIVDIQAFQTVCHQAIFSAQSGYLVTIGIKPSHAETGFGYIECGRDLDDQKVFSVKRFVEKPNLEIAKQFFAGQQHLWNSGIFCFQVKTLMKEFQQLAPTILEKAIECWHHVKRGDNNTFQFDPVQFEKLEDISLDYAVLEKSKKIVVVPGAFDWQDIGSWSAYKNLHAADEQGNAVVGDALMIDSHNTYIHSDKLVAAIGLRNLVVIDTKDALLISELNRSQEVKNVVQMLRKQSHETYFQHLTVERPWGSYSILDQGENFKVKRISVHPGASLSLQSHVHRCEHWVIVEGEATIINGEEITILTKNKSVYIPQNNKHRITNSADEELVLIEVQVGDYLGEDDIKRYDDLYGRVTV